ncbi:HEAT repeat containing 1 homolog l(2)k09022 [Musca autumnalis]|uniref:HEAT repeat containing 1 homolog l(2)k09022 n=1 Tax=Musca autumnalis TaxID=221902 RepID=UPI003CF9CF5A
MSTSLFEQLQRLKAPQSGVIADPKRRASILFDPKEAASKDRRTIYDLGIHGLQELIVINPTFQQFEQTLFDENTLHMERSVEVKEVNDLLNRNIKKFLQHLSPYFLLRPSLLCLEWLVRRFQVHEYNCEELLALVLPYHETNAFVKVIQTFTLKESDKDWYWLKPLQKPGKPLAKSAILNRAATHKGFLNFICKTTTEAIKELGTQAHLLQTQMNFYGSVVVGALETATAIQEWHITTLLPSLMKGLTTNTIDFASAAYIITARLVARTLVTTKLCNALITKVANVYFERLRRTAVLLLIWIFDSQKAANPKFSEDTLRHLVQQKWFLTILSELASENVDVQSICLPIIADSVHAINKQNSQWQVYQEFLENLIHEVVFPTTIAQQVISTFLDSYIPSVSISNSSSPNNSSLMDGDVIELDSDDEDVPMANFKFQSWYCKYLHKLERQYPTAFDLAIKESLSSKENDNSDNRSIAIKMALGYRLQSFGNAAYDIYESLYHHNGEMRLLAIKSLVTNLKDYQKRPQNYQLLKECLCDRIVDDKSEIVAELLKLTTEEILEVMGAEKFVESLITILYKIQMDSKEWSQLSTVVVKHLTNEVVIQQYDNNLILLAIMPLIFPVDSMATSAEVIEEILKSPLATKIAFLKKLCLPKGNTFNVADFKRQFLNIVSASQEKPSVIALFESVESQGDNYLKHAVQVYHFLMLVTACLKETHSAEKSLQIFRQIAKYINKFPIKHLDYSQGERTLNQLNYIPMQLFCDFLLTLTRHTNLDNIANCSWEGLKSSELEYFLTVFEFLTNKSFSDDSKQLEWSKTLKELFDTVFKNPMQKLAFLLDFYVYEEQTTISEYPVLRIRAFKLVQTLLKNNHDLKLEVPHIFKITIALLSPSQVLRLETLATLKVLLNDGPVLGEELQLFVKAVLERSEELSMDSQQYPLVLYGLLKGGGNKQNIVMGSKILKRILYILAQNESLEQAVFVERLLCTLVHISEDEEIIKSVVPLAIRALQLYTLDESVQHLKEPYASIFRLVAERFNTKKIDKILMDSKTWTLIENIFESSMVFVSSEDSFKSVTCVFLECLDELTFEKIPSKYKDQFLLLLITTLAIAENDSIFLAANKLLKKCSLNCEPLQEVIHNMYKSCLDSSKSSTPRRGANKRENMQSPVVQVLGLEWKQGVVLMELLENKKKLENSTVLIPVLFELLNCCLAVEEQSTVEYTKQLVLSALLNCCQRAIEQDVNLQTALPKTTFRVDHIVQCLRASQNPQTHHNALLLLSHCAGLFPQQVLHNIVDIFTFMGSSVVRHDDAFSFHIINDIIISIVPILVKEKTAVVPVLKVFSDIMLDVPEHRRLPLYTKLINTLGSVEHLWMFLCVVFEAHVIDDEKQRLLQKKSAKPSVASADQMSKRIEIVLELTNTFAPDEVLETCIQLMKYTHELPMHKQDKAERKYLNNSDNHEASLFDVNARSAKQLRHYKYVIMQFLSAITSSNDFLKKIAMLTDEEILEMKSYYQKFIIRILSYVPQVTSAIEKAEEASLQKFWKVILHHLHDVLDNTISLLSAEMLLVVVNGLLHHPLLSIRKKVIELLISKLQQRDGFFDYVDSKHFDNLLKPLSELINGILERDETLDAAQQNELVFLQQTALIAIKLLSKSFALKHIPEFKEILTTLTKISRQRTAISKIVLATVVLTMIEISSNLKAHSIAHLPKFMPQLIEILQDQAELVRQQPPDNICVAIVTGMQKLFETLPLFLGPYTVDIITALSSIGTRIKAQNNDKDQRSSTTLQKINLIWSKISTDIPLRILVPSCDKAYAKLMTTKNFADISVLMKLLHQGITHAQNKDLVAVHTELTTLFMQTLEFRLVLKDANLEVDVITNTETTIVEAFVAWVLKLSESSFRPLYHKLYNWAFQHDQPEKETMLTYFLLTQKIGESLKSLFVLFASEFVEDAARLLDECNSIKTEIQSADEYLITQLLKAILSTLYNIFLYDSKEFVNTQRFEYLMPAIVDQLENRLVLEDENLQAVLSQCISQLAVDVSSDVMWKQLNYQVLLKTRTTVPEVRIFAFNCCVEIARKLGEDFTPLLPETVPFVSELFEDENPRVEKNTRKSVQELEVILGESLQKYL